MGIWITHEIWTYGPNFIWNPCFREGPVGNSESRTGLTRNPINGVPSARFARLWRELQITRDLLNCEVET